MIELNKDYNRQEHSAMFVALPEEVKAVRIEKAGEDGYLVSLHNSTSQPTLITIQGDKISTSLNDNHRIGTDMVKGKTVEENVWTFFVRSYLLFTDGTGRYHKEEYIFTRANQPDLFQYFDKAIHTLSIKGMNDGQKPIKVKYISKDAAGSVTLRAKDGYIGSDDVKMPIRFIFTGSMPTFYDITKTAAKIIECIRAAENHMQPTEETGEAA